MRLRPAVALVAAGAVSAAVAGVLVAASTAAASAAAGWVWAARASGLPQSAAAVFVRPGSGAVVSVRPLCRLPDFAAARLPATVSTVASITVSGTRDFRSLWRQSG